MSIEISKIVQVYQQCINLLTAKNELLIQQESKKLNLLENRFPNQDSLFVTCPIFIQNSLNILLKNWYKMYLMYKEFKFGNNECIQNLKNKMNGLKNNTDLLTKQEQCISEMENLVKNWNQCKDPLAYYDIKKKYSLKQQLQMKRRYVKDGAAITKQSLAPMYSRKVQEQFKITIYQAYMDSNLIDKNLKQKTVRQWQNMKFKVYKQGKSLRNLNLIKYVVIQKNKFSQKFLDIYTRKLKLTQHMFVDYYQSLISIIKNIKSFWKTYLKNLENAILVAKLYSNAFKNNQGDMEKRQKEVIKFLQKTSQTVSIIFQIETPINILAILNQNFQIIPALNNLLNNMLRIIQTIQTSIRNCEDYLKKISTQIPVRQKQFSKFYSDDKSFLDANQKCENIVDKKLSQSYSQFLNLCYNLSNRNQKKFSSQSTVVREHHEISGLLAKQILSHSLNKSGKKNGESQFSESSSDGINSQATVKNNKLINIEKFLSKFLIFDSNKIIWSNKNVFSCALGPKFLIHGKIVILQQGIYFQSLFNKKNIFFGKTKIFIPKQEIIEIGTQNSLIIFPDAILIKTNVGRIYFHSLASRNQIIKMLNETYYPENKQIQDDCFSQIQFKDTDKKQLPNFTFEEINQLEKPFQVFILEKTFKNTKINKFFKRYFSQDKFQIRGQTYANFKIYFLHQIQGIQPKSTPFVPQAPSYFSYKSETSNINSFPKVSQKYNTYGKSIPKIPFLSSGGNGLCEDKNTFYWISPKQFINLITSKVGGFSLTQGMQIFLKIICKQQGNDMKIAMTGQIKFSKQSATNGLIKGPAISNLKESMLKMVQIIQKYQKGKKSRGKKGHVVARGEQNILLQQRIQKLEIQNSKLKKNIKIGILLALVWYLLTIIFCRILFS